jgi:hypothetical protein
VVFKWHAVTFRNSADEYAFTHQVWVEHSSTPTGEIMLPVGVLCGKELPDVMQKDLTPFAVYIDRAWISCPGCQIKQTEGYPG